MSHAFFELTAVLILAAGGGMLAKALRQPTILGYILVGVIVGPVGLLHLDNVEMLDALAEIGIASLLFLVGLDLRMEQVREYGKAALYTGLGQIVFTSIIGYAIVRLLGFAPLAALYVAVALTFSSTIIVVKLLGEKHALDTLYGRICVGFLLVQDFVALGFLILLSSLRPGMASLSELPVLDTVWAFGKGTLLLAICVFMGRKVLPPIMRWMAQSAEVMFLAALAWGMGVAALAASPRMGLSIEIGAFMAGVALSSSIERHHIVGRVKPLRDFFIVLFFVVLGSKMAISNIAAVAWPSVVLSLFVLIGNPLIVLSIMGFMGYRSRTSFLASVTVAQISEFSLILAALGLKLGHLDERAVTLVTVVGIVTIGVSSYMIIYAERLYGWISRPLRFFERHHPSEKIDGRGGRRGHVILIGCHRIGHNMLNALEASRDLLTVVDLDPEVVEKLRDRGIHAIYGDITDPEIEDAVGLAKAKTVISTVPDDHVAATIIERVRVENPKAKLLVTAQSEHEAIHYYRLGADYVILPHFMSGRHAAQILEKSDSGRELSRLRKHDLALIEEAF